LVGDRQGSPFRFFTNPGDHRKQNSGRNSAENRIFRTEGEFKFKNGIPEIPGEIPLLSGGIPLLSGGIPDFLVEMSFFYYKCSKHMKN